MHSPMEQQGQSGEDVRELLRHRAVIERTVRQSLGRDWRIEQVEDFADRASHPAAVLTGGAVAVFAKLGRSAWVADQFEREAESLRLLTSLAGVLTPTVLGCMPVDGGAILLMKSVEMVEWNPERWREYGRAVARLHAVKADAFGWSEHCYWGDLRQDNGWLPDWPGFFWRRRVEPRLRATRDLGVLPAELAREVEKLGTRLEKLCGPPVTPSLIHGDAHQNNVIATAAGPVFIDPAMYYGHPEVDLAYLDYFQPVSPEVFRGYQEATPIAPGFDERRELWRLPFHLACLEVEGERHLGRLREMLSMVQ